MQIFSDSDDLPRQAETRSEKSLLRSLLTDDLAIAGSWLFILVCVYVILTGG